MGFTAACSSLISVHHRFVYGEATGGVDDQDFMVVLACPVERGEGDIQRFLAGFGRKEIDVELLCQRAQLLDSGRAVHVAADQQHFLLVLLAQQLGQLAAAGGFTRALQAGHQDHGGRYGSEVERIVVLAHQLGQLAVHHADQRLTGGEAADDFLSQRGFLHLGDEFLDHRQRDVGFQQGEAHFAHGVLNVALGQPRLAAQIFDDAREALS